MNQLIKILPVLVFVLSLNSCKKSQSKSESQEQSNTAAANTAPKRQACVSFQGNGGYFSSQVGALISLLESNVEPVFATGGSSGAILAGVSRALVENPSLQAKSGFNPQDAALVLAASAPIIESTLFLPRLTTPFALLDALDVFLTGSSQGVIRADPSDGMVNAESIVGQSALVVEFYRTTDFSKVLTLKNFTDREKEISRLWKMFVNAVDVTPEQVAEAMLNDRETLRRQNKPELVQIQDRIFKMFRSKNDTFLDGYERSQQTWNAILTAKGKSLGLDSYERRQSVFKLLVEKVRAISNFDALAATLSGNFLLADPERVYLAFQGFEPRGRRSLEIPSNTILHATARSAKLLQNNWKEDLGLGSLHQVYFTNAKQSEQFRARLSLPDKNPLLPAKQGMPAVIPTERLVVTSQNLSSALAISTAEPSAFMRSPVALDAQSRERFRWIDDTHSLIGYGGWLEKISLGTARQFAECAADKVDTYFYTSDGLGMSRFTKMAFLGLFVDQPLRGLLESQLDKPSDIRALLSGAQNSAKISAVNAEQEFNQSIASMEQILTESRNSTARLGHIPMNFDHTHPLVGNTPQTDKANMQIRSNRRAMILAAYEFTRRLLAEQKLKSAPLKLWNVTGDEINMLSATSVEDVLREVNRVFPR